jgi:hypothetical protein
MAKLRVSLFDNTSTESKKRIGIEERQYIFRKNIQVEAVLNSKQKSQRHVSPVFTSNVSTMMP